MRTLEDKPPGPTAWGMAYFSRNTWGRNGGDIWTDIAYEFLKIKKKKKTARDGNN